VGRLIARFLVLVTLGALWVCLSSLPLSFAQAPVEVTADVDRSVVSTGDLVALTVTVAGDFQQVDEPELPLLSGLQVQSTARSSQFSMVNGVVTSRQTFTYRLAPTAPGSHTIDPITVKVDGITYLTDAITIEVTPGTAPAPASAPSAGEPAGPAPDQLAVQDLFVEAAVDIPAPFVGQQIIYSFRFYQAVNLLEQPRLGWPAFSGFWSESLSPNQVYEQTVAGRVYRVTEVRQALFPTAAGATTIGPATLTIPGGFFQDDTVLETNPVSVEVQPLPDGAPDDFAGAVGQFEITSWTEPEQARVNEPLTLFVRVSGSGNLATLPDPTQGLETRLPDWRVYDAQTTTEVSPADAVVQGSKTVERLLVPRAPGKSDLPGFSLAFFDPEQGRYRRSATDPLSVNVGPSDEAVASPPLGPGGKLDVDIIASDIRHIKPAPPALRRDVTTPLQSPLYWLMWLLPALAVSGVWAWERRRRRLSSDAAYARSRRALGAARGRLDNARKAAPSDPDAAYAAVAEAITNYLGDRFNLPAAGLTRDDVRQLLRDYPVSDELTSRMLSCLDWADSGRFAPGGAGPSIEDLIHGAEDVIRALDAALDAREAAR
jgi:hypothetical protein